MGEATLMNRVKSHPDVGERWYPELLGKIREEQGREARAKEAGKVEGVALGGNPLQQAQTVKAH